MFSATLIVQGKGKAKVTHTTSNTIRKIDSLPEYKQEHRLQKEMKRLIRSLFL